jgi:hypothetical protein
MTPDTTSGADWADHYFQEKFGDADDAAVDPVVPPESAAFMDDLSYLDLSHVLPENRGKHLELAVSALVSAMASDDGVAERNRHGRSVAAFSNEESVVVVVDGFGEVISVDRMTAALIAFAYHLRPRETDGA